MCDLFLFNKTAWHKMQFLQNFIRLIKWRPKLLRSEHLPEHIWINLSSLFNINRPTNFVYAHISFWIMWHQFFCFRKFKILLVKYVCFSDKLNLKKRWYLQQEWYPIFILLCISYNLRTFQWLFQNQIS